MSDIDFKIIKGGARSRRLSFATTPTWEELDAKLRQTFRIPSDVVIELHYTDRNREEISLSSDKELTAYLRCLGQGGAPNDEMILTLVPIVGEISANRPQKMGRVSAPLEKLVTSFSGQLVIKDCIDEEGGSGVDGEGQGLLLSDIPPFEELERRARDNLYDPTKNLKHWLRFSNQCRRNSRMRAEEGNLAESFVELTKATVLILEMLPRHPGYKLVLNATQKANLRNVRGFLFLFPCGAVSDLCCRMDWICSMS